MRVKLVCALVIIAMGSLLVGPVGMVGLAAAQGGGVFYESRPDEVALYLSDIAFARDEVVLPADQDARILLPPGTYIDTLIFKENGARVHNYRIKPVASDMTVYDPTSSYMSAGTAYVLTWEPSAVDAATRTISLEYLLPGAHWTPTYDMVILEDRPDGTSSVALAFFAEITNSALTLDAATVYLVAGRVSLSRQVDQVPQVTMNQYAVGYSNETVDLPGLDVGSVDLQHVYPLDAVTAAPGETVYTNVVDATFEARRLVVWNAHTDKETDVIYKVRNSSELPLAEGIVRAYRDALFLGSDFVETTPATSEGSITVGSLPDVRVHRTDSREYIGTGNDYYQHEVTLEVHNYGTDALDLMIFDRWVDQADHFEFSAEPERQPDNLLRWEVQIAAGESLTITYRFRTDA